jgi:hypothetical protein
MACMENPISQPSLELSTIWIPLINQEFEKKILERTDGKKSVID